MSCGPLWSVRPNRPHGPGARQYGRPCARRWKRRMPPDRLPDRPDGFAATIFDVDGVLVASPHEQAWREALAGFTDPARLTTELYQAHVAGKPRMDGARAVLEQLGVPDAARQAEVYAARKQALIEELIDAGRFVVFPDALRLAEALRAKGLRLAVASSSKNA